jgi:hypothetical protein
MKHLIVRLLIAAMTFVFGLVINEAWNSYRSPSIEELKEPEIPGVKVCDLIDSPRAYQKKLIRIRATVVDYGLDQSAYLYDYSCHSSAEGIRPISVFDDSHTTRADNIDIINKFLGTSGKLPRRVDIVAVGEIDCMIQRAGCTPNLFKIVRLDRAEALPADAPWPWKVEKCSH